MIGLAALIFSRAELSAVSWIFPLLLLLLRRRRGLHQCTHQLAYLATDMANRSQIGARVLDHVKNERFF